MVASTLEGLTRPWVAAWLLLMAVPARADALPDPGRDLELIESTEASEDPLGLDDDTGRGLERAARSLPKPSSKPLLPSPHQGEALSAIDGVRESSHILRVELSAGLALVQATLTFSSRAKHASEIAYRLPLPREAAVTRVQLCAGKSCVSARPSSSRQQAAGADEPLAIDALPIEDARGRALALRLAPIAAGGTLELSVDYVASAPIRGGRAHFDVLPRGYDPNLANTALQVETRELTNVVPASELTLEPWTPLALAAELPPRARRTSSVRASCGRGLCSRTFEALAAATPSARPLWLLIDASPSMEGPARGRVGAAVAALLANLPEATPVRVFAFAARAQALGRHRADELPLTTLADAPLLDLDAATHVSAPLTLAAAELARERPRIVVLSDGLFDTSAREREALRVARRQGAEPWLVTLGDREARLASEFVGVLAAGELSELALRSQELAPLEDLLRTVSQPSGPRGLRHGEQRVIEHAPKDAIPLDHHSHWLAFWLNRDRATVRFSAGRRGPDVIAALPYEGIGPGVQSADSAMPKESVLSMLRTQLVPQARACLRSDRKGRGDYAVELTFHALFAEREVYGGTVEGRIAGPLRRCLEALLPKLRVPAFTGAIRVRYPVHTEREAPPPVIELAPDASEQLERAFGPSSALP